MPSSVANLLHDADVVKAHPDDQLAGLFAECLEQRWCVGLCTRRASDCRHVVADALHQAGVAEAHTLLQLTGLFAERLKQPRHVGPRTLLAHR
jgi:hypothetical protein